MASAGSGAWRPSPRLAASPPGRAPGVCCATARPDATLRARHPALHAPQPARRTPEQARAPLAQLRSAAGRCRHQWGADPSRRACRPAHCPLDSARRDPPPTRRTLSGSGLRGCRSEPGAAQGRSAVVHPFARPGRDWLAPRHSARLRGPVCLGAGVQ
jgi:hypothetical protein